MAEFYENDMGLRVYHSHDSINKFKITVKLERITSCSFNDAFFDNEDVKSELNHENKNETGDTENNKKEEAKSETHEKLGKDNETDKNGNTEKNPTESKPKKSSINKMRDLYKDEETYTFRWQEKLFSNREKILYTDEDEFETVLGKKYCKDVANLKDKTKKRLFTYIDADNYVNLNEINKKITTDDENYECLLTQAMKKISIKKFSRFDIPIYSKNTSKWSMQNIINDVISQEDKTKTHLLCKSHSCMFIMADLSPTQMEIQKDNVEYEEILCAIYYDGNGVLYMTPGFNETFKKYKIKSKGIGQDMYEYRLEICDKDIMERITENELKIQKELYRRHNNYLKACVGKEFVLPLVGLTRLFIMGEITLLKNFEYEDLYIEYFLEIPKDWKMNDTNQKVSGISQICKTKAIENGNFVDNIAYIQMPFNFDLLYNNCYEEDFSIPWPNLYVKVSSYDDYNRYRIEGYSYTRIPDKGGFYKRKLNCWRPLSNTNERFNKIKRFFVGGGLELNNITQAHPQIFQTENGKKTSRLGFNVLTTGSVDIKFNCMFQSCNIIEKSAIKYNHTRVIETIDYELKNENILDMIIEQYNIAMDRLVKTRENIKNQLTYVE